MPGSSHSSTLQAIYECAAPGTKMPEIGLACYSATLAEQDSAGGVHNKAAGRTRRHATWKGPCLTPVDP